MEIKNRPAVTLVLIGLAIALMVFYFQRLEVYPIELARVIGGTIALWLPFGVPRKCTSESRYYILASLV